MDYRKLGNTDLEVSRIGIGTAALGRPGYINLGHGDDLNHEYDPVLMEKNMFDVLDIALSFGVKYFDTARSYGRGEEFLGKWLKDKVEGTELTVGSKWGYTYTADWKVTAIHHEVKDHSLEVLNRQWEETKDNLDGYIDLYQIHSATLDSGVLKNIEVLDRLWELKNEGVKIGLSVSGKNQPEIINEALNVKRAGKLLFDTVQATWNILETSASVMLEKASKAGMGVIIKEGVANGRLTDRNQESSFAGKKQVLQSLAEKHAVTIDAIAIAFVLAQPWCDVVLSGASNIDQFESNLKANGVQFSEEDLNELRRLVEEPKTYWNSRKELDWN
ncbi:aldo/keto reductase [Limibacter armeniacum]|uniref:aldo/keto reductase n=1 Tax=Limibacter armeniacum TaxID=466084 RepID=UPI002FE62F3D